MTTDVATDLPPAVKRAWPAMGSVVSVHVHDRVDGGSERARVDAAIDSVSAEIERLEAMFSTFRPTSVVSRIARHEMHLLDAPREVADVLDACAWLESASSGAFSAWRGGRLDPAGFVKGWAVERASRLLDEAGFRHWMVSLGGDMQFGDPPNDGWRVGLADPRDPRRIARGLTVGRGAVATSGTAARGLHIDDPRTGRPATAWASVTVVGPNLAWADAFATTAFVLGAEGPAWVEQFPGHSVIAIDGDGRIFG